MYQNLFATQFFVGCFKIKTEAKIKSKFHNLLYIDLFSVAC